MSSSDRPDRPDRAPAARRSRRVVRPAGTVGGDDANLLSTHPALPAEPPAGPVPASPEAPTADPVVARRSVDDSDVGWGDRDAGSNDDRLSQDKPPHW